MPRFEKKIVLMMLLASLSSAVAAPCQRLRGAQVSGCVRDASGMPQGGALVTVLTARAVAPRSAYTDLHGRYAIGRLVPGTYDVSVAVPSHLPRAHTSLKLHAGMRAVLNLTLVTLSDAATWLPAEHRGADEPSDDWQWTLRSAANRPILRWAGDDAQVRNARSERVSSAVNRSGQVAFTTSGGGFGEAGTGESLARSYGRGTSIITVGLHLLEPDRGGAGRSPSGQLTVEVKSNSSSGSRSTSQISMESHPEFISGAQGSGLQSVRFARAERFQLGEWVVLDVGSAINLSRVATLLVTAHPFLQMELHPARKLKVGYGFASSKDTQSYDDLDALQQNGEGIVGIGNILKSAAQLHQRLYLQAGENNSLIRVSRYWASPGTAVVTGMVSSDSALPTPADPSLLHIGDLQGTMSDPSSATFRTLAGMTRSAGWSIEIARSLAPTLLVTLDYSTGQALVFAGDGSASTSHVAAVRSQAIMLALRSRIVPTGAGLQVSYRWQPSQTITAVDSFGRMSDQSYLSLHLRQPLAYRGLLPSGTVLTADATNLLAEGYRRVPSNGPQTAFLTQSPRALTAGVAIDF